MRSRGKALQKGFSVRTELVKQLLDAHKVPALAADFIHWKVTLKGGLYLKLKCILYRIWQYKSQTPSKESRRNPGSCTIFSNLQLSSHYLPGDVGSDVGIHGLSLLVSDPKALSNTPHLIFLCLQLGTLLALAVHNLIHVFSV